MFGGKTNIFSSSSKECKFLRTTKFYIIGTISTILLITLTVFSFSPIINKTESAKAAAIIADASINITSASDMVNVDITLNEKKSVFAASTADLTFNVLTNSVAGYKLAISSTDPSGELTNTEYGDKIDTITSPTNATTFANDTTTTYDNKWGIKPSKLNSTANTDYLPAPTSPTILDITSLPNTIVPNNYSIGIAARLDSTKSVGAYTDTIILVAITNPISYEFKFLDNTSDSSVTNLPPSESGSSIAIGGFIMPTKAPTRTGYTFKSWCNGTVTHIAGNDSTCSGTTYDKGAPFNDFNDPVNPNNKISFYAMWAVDNYSLTLNNDDATTVGSTKARVFYNNNIIYDGDSGTSAITNPTRAYNISGFTTSGNNAAGASVSSAATLSFTYGFDGWYTPGTSPIRIITPSKTLVANTPYTNSAGKWTSTSGAELHAHWLDNGASITLPTITKSGFTCGWTTTPSGATSIEYASGLTGLRPTKDMTLYGVCTPNPYDITIRTATGIDKVSLNGVDCTSTSGCLVSGLIFGESYTLTTEVTDGYTFVTWNPGSYGSVSDPTNVTTSYTVGAGNSTVTPSTTINQYNLTVDPNGGIWESSTSPQIFTQDFMSTKTIADPTDGPTYAISYDANDQGASYSEIPDNIQKPFTSWTISGSGTGSLSGTTFTFGVGDNTLTANYGITSKPFNLPIITKTGHTCGWAKGSASGEQIVSGGSTTITEDTTFYAVCTPNPYDITIKTTLGIDKVTLNGVDCTSTSGCVVSGLIFGQSYNLVAEPTPGYTFASWDAGSYGTISDYTSERTSYTVGAGNSTITPMITVNKYMLIVNPNGGIWESASYPQIFEQYYKTTKTINNPSNGPIYNISYDPNGQGATYTGTPTIIERPFTNWTNSGPGTLSGTTFTFGLGNNILIANYDTASNPFNLPTITKLGHTCSWAEGSPSGPQTAGGVSITISSDTTFYAVCTPNPYDITIKTVTGISKVTLNGVDCTSSTGCTVSGLIFDQSYNLVAEVEPGYTFASWSAGSYGSISDTTATSTSYTVGAGNSTITPSVTINKYTLTVNPNGGTWSGSTSSQTFTQNYGTTKTIADPTAGPTYSISYNANGQGASYTGSPTSVQRPFTSWTISDIGTGTLSGTTFTYGIGDNTLTANYNTTSNSFKLPAISKTGYSCKWAEGSTTGTQYAGGTSRTITANTTYYAVCSINSYTLTVNPNGGTWSGKTTSQTFTQNYGTTKTIANPSATPSYSISYNGNSQGASYTGSPTSVSRSFTSWSKSGSGTLSGTTFTFGAGNGTLTANYNTTSNSFKLPAISKTGHSCKWAEGSTSGTQYAGGTSRTITGNKTYYAMCSANSYNITVKTTTGISSVTINGNTCTSSSGCTYSLKYNSSYNISASVVSGASFSSWSAGAGSFGNASASSTTYTVKGAATITPSINTSTTPIMQDFSASTCKSKETANVIDSRDNHIYSVRYITNACWMVNNISYGCNGDTKTSGSSASYCKSGDPGAWYTFSAASSICPSGWHSPTRTEAYVLAQGTGYSTSILYAFNGIHYGGYYYGGSFHSASDTGYWWTDSSSYYLHFRDGNNYIDLQDDGNSNCGLYVRCVRS